MSENWKNIAKKASIGLALTLVLLGAYLLGSNKRKQVLCTKIEITINDSLETPYLSTENINEFIASDYGKVLGTPIDNLDLYKIESLLNNKGEIIGSEVYVTNNGVLKISVSQRKPIMRFQAKNYAFYCDKEGYILPLKQNFHPDVLLIDGYTPIDTTDCLKGRPETPAKVEWLDRILRMTEYINSSSIWKNRIAQIHIEDSGYLIVVPRDGKEIFLMGPIDEFEKKFEKMQIYYESIVPASEGKEYNLVDLRFDRQIVCRNTEKENN